MYDDNVEYAAKRLDDTLVRKTNGNPFYVTETYMKGGRVVCLGTDFVSFSSSEETLDNLDLTPVSLGFFNLSGKMAYACRKPMRRDWKQGLSLNNLMLYGAEKNGFSFATLTNTILDNYPSFEECVIYTKKTRNRSMAFSREFGLSSKDNNHYLIYRKHIVGNIVDGVAVLSPDKFFLEQHLNSSMRNA